MKYQAVLSGASVKLKMDVVPGSLVPFDAFRIIGTSLVFRNERIGTTLSDADLLDGYSFAVKNQNLCGCFDAQRRVFFADRYGGAGLLRNGGSGRCGYDGEFQIKGIGRTPLVGRGVASSYADGVLALCDAIFEAAWGEIANCILPFGAVRAVGIVGTAATSLQRQGKAVARGLLIREAALRPAHFERAVYFTPSRHFLSLAQPHDARRTADALSRLPGILRHAFLAGSDLVGSRDLVINGLVAFAERFATQVAAAKAKRIMHGSLTSSNLALDGRWLDFGATTCLPLDGFGDNSDHLPFWHEPDTVMQGVQELLFYAEKYIDGFRPGGSQAFNAMSSAYIARLSTETRDRLLLLTGLPRAVLHWMPADNAHANTLAGLIATMLHGGFKPPSDISDPVADSTVGAVCLILARYFQDPSCESRIAPYVMGRVGQDVLLKTYLNFIDQAVAVAAHRGLSPTDLLTAIRINALRFSRYPYFMYRPKLLRQIEECIGTSTCPESLRASVTRLLDTIHSLSGALLTDSEDLKLVLWSDEIESLRFNLETGEWQLAGAGTNTRFRTQNLAFRIESSHTGRQLCRHFGPSFLEFIV